MDQCGRYLDWSAAMTTPNRTYPRYFSALDIEMIEDGLTTYEDVDSYYVKADPGKAEGNDRARALRYRWLKRRAPWVLDRLAEPLLKSGWGTQDAVFFGHRGHYPLALRHKCKWAERAAKTSDLERWIETTPVGSFSVFFRPTDERVRANFEKNAMEHGWAVVSMVVPSKGKLFHMVLVKKDGDYANEWLAVATKEDRWRRWS